MSQYAGKASVFLNIFGHFPVFQIKTPYYLQISFLYDIMDRIETE